MILGEMCVLSLIYGYVAGCMFCAVRCVVIMCFSLLFSNYSSYVILIFFFFIINVNMKDWTLRSVPSPELQLLAPTLLRSSNCSPSLWSVVV